jgi:PDZ domain
MSRVSKGVALAARLMASTILFTHHAFALPGDVKLPDPYVSRALEAVLLPINDQVREAFKLDKKDEGVLVLSVEPGGTADKRGVKPGDVLSAIKNHKIKKPIDVDTLVYYWVSHGQTDFTINNYRGGEYLTFSGVTITMDEYKTAIDLAAVGGWTAWTVATAFSYSEFYSEYSSVMVESYASSETTVEETSVSEEFASEMQSESEDTDHDGTPDGIDADDDNDGTSDEADHDDNNDGQADAADSGDDGASDAQDASDDNGGGDDTAEADDGGDDGSDDGDAGGDDGGDDGDGGGDDGGGDE